MKKFILVTIAVLLLIVVAMAVVPFLFKDKILNMAKETANEQLHAKVDFSNDISLSLFSHFPDFTLGIKELSVVGVDTFEGDTLLSLKEFNATLDLMSVIKGDQISIVGIELLEPRIHAIVNKDGKANWDIAKASTDTTQAESPDTAQSSFHISLNSFLVKDAGITYEDYPGKMHAEIIGLTHELKGDFSQDLFLLITQTSCRSLSYTMGGIPYLNKVNMEIRADIDANMKDMKFTFKQNEVKMNNLTFGFDGWFGMSGDDMNMDLAYKAEKAAFKDFLSLVPAIYSKDFDQLKSSGNLGFNGFIKGTYNTKQMPAFAFNLLVENGMFQYPALPMPVTEFELKLAVTNPDGQLNNTRIDLSKLHFNIANSPFDARLIATNIMQDPAIDAAFKGELNLGNVAKIVPLEKGTELSGMVTMDMTAKGNVSTVQNGNYEAFNAGGMLAMSNIRYAAADLQKPFSLSETNITFNPKTVKLNKFDAQIGSSDLSMTGELSNFFGYAFGKGTLQGVLNLKSGTLNANEFMSAEPAPETKPEVVDTTSMVAPEIPSNIHFTINSTIGKIVYTNMEITDFNGQLVVADQKLSFNKVALKTLGAGIGMDGYYETTNPKRPTVAINFSISNLDIQKAAVTFNTVKKYAPIAEKTDGTFSTVFIMKSVLDEHLNPVYDGLFAEGVLDIPQARFKNVEVFNKAAEKLKYDKLKDPGISNVHIQYKIEKGRVYTQPFDMNLAGQKLTLSGSTGLDQTIDYIGKLNIPRSSLGVANGAVNELLAKANAKAGTSVKLSENIPVNLTIKGTFTKPEIGTNLGDVAKDESGSVKDQLKAEAERKKAELEAKARAEAERVKKETEAKVRAEADKAKAEAEAKARAEAERIKKEAEAEKERLRKKAEEEAKKKLKGLLGK